MQMWRSYRDVLFIVMLFSSFSFADDPDVRFRCLVLSEEFYSEGADIGDFNSDGHQDMVSGPFWYAGPDFRERHRYMKGDRVSIKAYSKHFFSFVHDLNDDQRPDILIVGMPGQTATWFENPGGDVANSEEWPRHHVLNDVGNESPTLTDLTGDGKPELICCHDEAIGYMEPNWKEPTEPWKFTTISDRRGYGLSSNACGRQSQPYMGGHSILFVRKYEIRNAR